MAFVLMTEQQIRRANAAATGLTSSMPKGQAVEESQSIGSRFNPEP
jgi:hypothetical protein